MYPSVHVHDDPLCTVYMCTLLLCGVLSECGCLLKSVYIRAISVLFTLAPYDVHACADRPRLWPTKTRM